MYHHEPENFLVLHALPIELLTVDSSEKKLLKIIKETDCLKHRKNFQTFYFLPLTSFILILSVKPKFFVQRTITLLILHKISTCVSFFI